MTGFSARTNHVRVALASMVTMVEILYSVDYASTRQKYRERLHRHLLTLSKFAMSWWVALSLIRPEIAIYAAGFVIGMSLTLLRFPQRRGVLSWAYLLLNMLSATLYQIHFSDIFFRDGVSHSLVAAANLMFFAGLGAAGAVAWALMACATACCMAPSGAVALHVCVASSAQVALSVVVEVSLLHTLHESEKLVEGMKALEQKKANFIAVVTHELKTPLHGIIGLSEALIANDGGAYQSMVDEKHHLKLILGCGQRLLDMVCNIMDTSALVQGNSRTGNLTRSSVRLDHVVEEVVSICAHSMGRNGRKLLGDGVDLINAVGPLPAIEADAYHCNQLIFNLVMNAVKFTEHGHIKILGGVDDVAGSVTITVEDTGIGVPAERLPHVFDPFEQEDESEQRRYDGLGLGLSICREVAIKHGGTITVDSTVGVGSKFQVTLPYKAPQNEAAPKPPASRIASAAGGLDSAAPLGHDDTAPLPPLHPDEIIRTLSTAQVKLGSSTEGGDFGLPDRTVGPGRLQAARPEVNQVPQPANAADQRFDLIHPHGAAGVPCLTAVPDVCTEHGGPISRSPDERALDHHGVALAPQDDDQVGSELLEFQRLVMREQSALRHLRTDFGKVKSLIDWQKLHIDVSQKNPHLRWHLPGGFQGLGELQQHTIRLCQDLRARCHAMSRTRESMRQRVAVGAGLAAEALQLMLLNQAREVHAMGAALIEAEVTLERQVRSIQHLQLGEASERLLS